MSSVTHKICFLSSVHPPFDKRVFDKEAVYLSRAGYSVVHLCPGSGSQNGTFKGVQVVTYPKRNGLIGRLFQLSRLFRLGLKQKADCYHCNEVDSWFIGVLIRIFHGKPCIFDVHEHYPSTFAESRFPRFFQPFIAFLVRLSFRLFLPFTSKIVMAKRSVSDDFPINPNDKILVLNYTPLSALKFSQEQSKPSSVNKSFTMVHLGLFSKLRGWPQVLEAMSMMSNSNLNLLVIGEINDGTSREFEKRVLDLGLSERVDFLDWMPFEKAFQYLLEADIGLIAFQPGTQNHVYAMPHKMFDYMAAGLAVICPEFAIEIAPSVHEKGCGVLVDPSCPAELAKELDNLLSDPETVKAMGRKGMEAVKDEFNWENEMARLIEMYAEIFEVKSSSAS